MMLPTLTPSEIAAVQHAGGMERIVYPGGSVVAQWGRATLFAAGGPESFAALWKEAKALRESAKQGETK